MLVRQLAHFCVHMYWSAPTDDAFGQFGGSPELAVAARSNVDHLGGRGADQHSTAAHILLQRATTWSHHPSASR